MHHSKNIKQNLKMKNINKISIVFILLLGITFTSCETTDLDMLDDPNNITVSNGELERYMVVIQRDFAYFAEQMGRNGAQLTRIEQMSGINYAVAFEPVSTNSEWRLAYARMFSDMINAEAIAIELGNNRHLGVIKTLKAYTLMTLVDYFGDIPFSEANNLGEFPAPGLDDDATVYAVAMTMLNEALVLLNDDASLGLENDFYYNNDFSKWTKLVNTLKMNAFLSTRLVDGEATSKFNAIVNSGNFISSTSDDFEFHYVASLTPELDARHVAYQADYASAGAGRYRSNWLMDEMLNDDDPRRRYYFYRQNDCTPGNIGVDGLECPADPERLFCSTQSAPSHYPGSMVYCSVAVGYWGRDHGFGGGIPPDTFRRTAVGVYPAAGRFDDDSFASINVGQGGGGAGITPIRLASWSHLMVAEMDLANGNTGGARTHLEHAMDISIDKVMGFGSVDPEANLADYAPSAAAVNNYITSKLEDFDSADTNGKWNVLGVQQFVAHYGNGSDSYNFYRRTGFPTSLQFTVETSPGNFVRSFFYPADEANTNQNVPQKPNVDVKVFWDNNPSSPGFPSAN